MTMMIRYHQRTFRSWKSLVQYIGEVVKNECNPSYGVWHKRHDWRYMTPSKDICHECGEVRDVNNNRS